MSVSLIDGHIDDDVLTDEQIIKALECCLDASPSTCKNCPLFNVTNSTMVCSKIATKFALDLINRQKANAEGLTNAVKYLTEQVSSAKAEAVKEFAERLKSEIRENMFYYPAEEHCERIDNLVKEMVGEG